MGTPEGVPIIVMRVARSAFSWKPKTVPDLVCIKTYNNRLEAELEKGRLDSQGIQAMISADDAGGMRPDLSWSTGVRLLVKQEDAHRALEIL